MADVTIKAEAAVALVVAFVGGTAYIMQSMNAISGRLAGVEAVMALIAAHLQLNLPGK